MFHRVSSIIAPLLFALAAFYNVSLTIYEYIDDPYLSSTGKVVDKYGMLHAQKMTLSKFHDEYLLRYTTQGAVEKIKFSPIDTTYLSVQELEKIKIWKSEGDKEINCAIQKFPLANLDELDQEYKKLEGYQNSTDTLKLNDEISFVYSIQYNYSKRLGFTLENTTERIEIITTQNDDFNSVEIGDNETVYYSKNSSLIACHPYYFFQAFNPLSAFIEKEGYFFLFMFLFGLICLGIAGFNLLRGGQVR